MYTQVTGGQINLINAAAADIGMKIGAWRTEAVRLYTEAAVNDGEPIDAMPIIGDGEVRGFAVTIDSPETAQAIADVCKAHGVKRDDYIRTALIQVALDDLEAGADEDGDDDADEDGAYEEVRADADDAVDGEVAETLAAARANAEAYRDADPDDGDDDGDDDDDGAGVDAPEAAPDDDDDDDIDADGHWDDGDNDPEPEFNPDDWADYPDDDDAHDDGCGCAEYPAEEDETPILDIISASIRRAGRWAA